MKRGFFITLALVLAIGVLSSTTIADVPRIISYQGILTDSEDDPVPDSTYEVTFRIYDACSGGSTVWTEIQDVTTQKGFFTVLLGSEISFPDSLFIDSTLCLSIQVAPYAEMSPRTRLVSSPYAFVADVAVNADMVDGLHANAFADSNHTHIITSEWIEDGTIQFIDIGQNDAVDGQVMKWNGTVWAADDDSVGVDASNWTVSDSVLYTNIYLGLARGGADNALYGDSSHTMVNFGVSCTTGTFGQSHFFSTISGGKGNKATYPFSAVSGGYNNTANGRYATIGGGCENTASNFHSTVGGGLENTASGYNSTVSGGMDNHATQDWATVGGGRENTANGYNSTVGGGYGNDASGFAATVCGCGWNSASGNYSMVGGGRYDTTKVVYGGVFSGYSNLAGDDEGDTAAFVGGGYDNSATNLYATVCGGKDNTASGWSSTVGGGTNNTASNAYSTVGGGIENTAGEGYTTVSGGFHNTAGNSQSTIGGGWENTASGVSSTIGGGNLNVASGYMSTISGGHQNISEGDYSVISGGFADTITTTANYSYLFGIGSKLSEDSTFMVDMPHVRFGDETNGYEFPPSDGSDGQVMATDGNGQLNWTDVSSGGTGIVPVGSVISWLKSFPNTPSLPNNFVECNGQTLSDPESIYDGQTIPNLNGSGGANQFFLRGSTTSGATGGADQITLVHVESAPPTQNNFGTEQESGYDPHIFDPKPPYYEVVWIMRIK